MSEPSKPASDPGTGEPASGVARAWTSSGEQTLLGVTPPIALPPLPVAGEPPPPAAAAPAAPRPASSGAIAASRVISVSDAAPVTPAAASPAPTASPVASASPAPNAAPMPEQEAPRLMSVPAQSPPARPASIGGWQSAGPAMAYQAPSLIETLTSMRSPLADLPPSIESAPTVPDATPIFGAPPPAAPQASALEAVQPEAALPEAVQPEAAQPELPPLEAAPAAPALPAVPVAGALLGGWQPVMHTVPIPIARKSEPPPAAAPVATAGSPEMFASTATSDDYLRAARDVVRAERDAAQADARPAAYATFGTPAAPAGDALANAATLQFESVPPVRAPLAEQSPAPSLPISVNFESSWRRLEGPRSATMPLGAPRTTFPSWRALLLVTISVLALIAIAAAAFVAVRRFATSSQGTSEVRRLPPSEPRALGRASAAAPASSARAAVDESELAARAARLVLLGRHDDARPLYSELARANPEAPAYAALERVLSRARGHER